MTGFTRDELREMARHIRSVEPVPGIVDTGPAQEQPPFTLEDLYAMARDLRNAGLLDEGDV